LTKASKTSIGEKIVTSTKWCWENWTSTFRRLKIDPYISPCTKINFKGVKYLNFETGRGKHRKNPEGIGKGNAFLNRSPIAQKIRLFCACVKCCGPVSRVLAFTGQKTGL
jgi:hypothetical protein